MPFLTQGKTNWKYILIVVILALIVGGGILWWVKTQEIPFPEFPEIKKPEKIEDETANWKTYRNEEYGFEFKYPEGQIKEFKNWSESKNDFNAIVQLNFGDYFIAFHGIPVGIMEEGIESQKEQILINNQLEIRESWTFPDRRGFAFISLNYPKEPTYPYFLIYHSNDPRGLELIDKILSTFRFLE